MPTIHINGTSLEYIEQGHGDPLIFVHGSLGDFRSWGMQVEAFAQRYQVIAYSRRYHFPNPWVGDGHDYSPRLHAEDLAALITARGSAPIHIVASSYGAYTALVLATKHPNLCRTLVLGEPPLLPWLRHTSEGPALLATFMTEAWQPAGAAFAQGNMKRGVQLFIDGVMGRGVFDQLPVVAQAMMLDNAPEMQVETTKAEGYFSPFTCDDARKIQIRTLLLNGERSPRMFHLITEELAKCLANTERALIPRASHSIHQETRRRTIEPSLHSLRSTRYVQSPAPPTRALSPSGTHFPQ
jgi:non-heme chloroperoxidase